MDERDVVASLNELDDLIADARRRKERASASQNVDASSTITTATTATATPPPTPPHLLPPASLLAAHLGPFLRDQTDTITQTLAAIQADNASVADAITSQRAEIEGLLRGVEGIARDLQAAAAALQTSEEVKGIEAELESAVGEIVR